MYLFCRRARRRTSSCRAPRTSPSRAPWAVERPLHLGRQPQALQLRGARLQADVAGHRGAPAVRRVLHRQGPARVPPLRVPEAAADPVLDLLNRTTCTGAKAQHPHTIVRAAPDVMRNERGMKVAMRLREMWANGCDVGSPTQSWGSPSSMPSARRRRAAWCPRSTSSRTDKSSTATSTSGPDDQQVVDGNPKSYVTLRARRAASRPPRTRTSGSWPGATPRFEVPALHRLLVRELPQERAPTRISASRAGRSPLRASTWTGSGAWSPIGSGSVASVTGIAL